ncbi:MAG: Chloramphenicol acetyltransferase [uncultured bacterium]|uniref:CatA-like O-acetyltransferase n=1 Tax=Cypionkella sp. TaxID=2811411 RepID=UPI000284E662|nr:CatA-like O-acetyltransferase [Cypionkella sp.]EKE16611.1 MAG: Chloramphenicol acetyltransferase [uncultured bacterium]KAF0173819.1 MAG: Chloramphenicol acetyltransferase [Paracoccaceae bacterium]MDO8326779.1 CatA-like O-acetyltransferase [Cypionkella sp.]
MTATEIPLHDWPRRETLALFRRFQKPQYAVTARVDVTRILGRRAEDDSFSGYLACIHAIGTALHAVPELACRIRGDTVVRHDRMMLSPTLQFDDGRLGFTYLDWLPVFEDFAATARVVIADTLAGGALKPGVDGDDGVAFLSCQPWLDFTAFDNPVFDRDDSVPRICWGRYTPEVTGRWTMAVAMQVHHGLMDGVHVAQFFKAMQQAADRF